MPSYPNYETPILFQLKGVFYPLNVLQLFSSDLLALEKQLDIKISQAPKFFHHAPIVIDLQKLSESKDGMDFKRLIDIFISKKLIPVGIKGANAVQQAAAAAAGFAILPDNGKERKINHSTVEITELTAPFNAEAQTKVITKPIRSGQQIYAQSDLVVVASVSQGAELLAEGHIHVYGPLRGRALAGIIGDENAQIFCQSLEPELISIAGQYKISEDIESSLWGKAANIALVNGHLHIRPL